MKHGRKGYVKSSAFYDVSLNKSDTYVSVIRKICDAIGEDCCDEMRLFNGKGAVIPDGPCIFPPIPISYFERMKTLLYTLFLIFRI